MKSKKKEKNNARKQASSSLQRKFRLVGKVFFLTFGSIVPQVEKRTKSDPKTYENYLQILERSGSKITKQQLTDFLLNNPNDRTIKPTQYLVCEQSYLSGQSHFHAVLIYDKIKQLEDAQYFDYLGIHPNIQKMRNMKAALDYVYKQDSSPLTNMDVLQQQRFARVSHTSSLYGLLQQQMLKTPFIFDVFEYCRKYDLGKGLYKTNYTKAVNLVKSMQQAQCNHILSQRPGIQYISRQMIQSLLTPEELKTYDSWSGYQTIVDSLNTMTRLKGERPMKTPNLLITGLPNTGKTSLFSNPNHPPSQKSLDDYCSVYPMGMNNWFPRYRSSVYDLILWNQARLTSYPYDLILKLLEGTPVDLPTKGGSSRKADNPLIILTSNMTLEEMIEHRFKKTSSYVNMAHSNLGVRLTNLIIPPGYDLFLLQKLFLEKLLSPD